MRRFSVSIQPVAKHVSEADLAYWKTRAEQLQTALDTRIVIEQAKGVFAERVGCDPEAAFSVLRREARSKRLKLHELASQIVSAAATGDPGRGNDGSREGLTVAVPSLPPDGPSAGQ
jgi:ANTAR domain